MSDRKYDPRYSLIRTTKPETGKPQGTDNQWSGGGTNKGAPNSHEKRSNLADVLASRNTEPNNPSPASTKQETGKPQETGNQWSGGGASKGPPNSHEKRSNLADMLASRNIEPNNPSPASTKRETGKPQGTDNQWSGGGTNKGAPNSYEKRSNLADMLASRNTEPKNPSPASTMQETGKPQGPSNRWSGGGTSKVAPNSHEQRSSLAKMIGPGYTQ